MSELPPPSGDPAPPADPKPNNYIDCDFCECRLSPRGEVLRRGGRAAKFLELEDAIKTQNATIAELREDLAKARALVPPAKVPSGGWTLDND